MDSALLCAVFLAPFLLIYLPALKLALSVTGSTQSNTSHLSSYFWLGPDISCGEAFDSTRVTTVAYPTENHLGFGVAVTSLVCSGVGVGHRAFGSLHSRQQRVVNRRSGWLSAMLVSSLVITVMTVRWGSFSPWWFVYEFVPGASVMVGVGRWALTLTLPVAILIAGDRLVSAALAGRYVPDQRRFSPPGSSRSSKLAECRRCIPARWRFATTRILLRAIPGSCEAFFLVPPVQSDNVPIIGRGISMRRSTLPKPGYGEELAGQRVGALRANRTSRGRKRP